MTSSDDLSLWVALPIALFVLFGAGLTLVGSIGLLRLKSFYARVHAPTLGSTLGAGCILIASVIFFSMTRTRPAVHELIIAVFLTVTTPATLILLVRAALHRDRARGSADVPGSITFVNDKIQLIETEMADTKTLTATPEKTEAGKS